MAARHGALDQGPLAASVREEIGWAQGNEFRLVLHVLAAGGEGKQQQTAETAR
jgi:hypothetical protein